jgi:excisionase family DNA binding protein
MGVAPTPPPPPILLTLPEAARELRLSRQTMYALIRRGDLEAVHIGRAARVRRADVLALVGIESSATDVAS